MRLGYAKDDAGKPQPRHSETGGILDAMMSAACWAHTTHTPRLCAALHHRSVFPIPPKSLERIPGGLSHAQHLSSANLHTCRPSPPSPCFPAVAVNEHSWRLLPTFRPVLPVLKTSNDRNLPPYKSLRNDAVLCTAPPLPTIAGIGINGQENKARKRENSSKNLYCFDTHRGLASCCLLSVGSKTSDAVSLS